jgi:integrase
MANISTVAGKRRIQFTDVDDLRKTIYLPEGTSKKQAESIKNLVERLLAIKILGGSIDRDDAIFLTTDGRYFRPKLEQAGLVEPQEPAPTKPRQTLEAFLAGYLVRRGQSVKPGTVEVWKQVVENLKAYMPQGIYLDDVTAGHAKAFLESITGTMAKSTVDKRVRFARQFFADAVDWELISTNPFAKVKTTTPKAKSNVDVPLDTIERVLSACNPTWRTIVALSRLGGLRCPSEVLSLRWCDVDFDRGLMYIPEPKVEHHDGRGVRTCPIFGELRPYLDDAFELRTTEYVVDQPAYRDRANTSTGWKNANLRTQFIRILDKAGVKPWKRLFHSMRASRQTELERQHPLHVVCAWLGNTERIARSNYLLITDADIERAKSATQITTHLGQKVTQIATQQQACTEYALSQQTLENIGKNAVFVENPNKIKRRGQDSNLRTGLTRSVH